MPPRQKLLVLLATTAFAVLVLDRAVLQPLSAAWKSRSTELETLQRRVAQGSLLVERDNDLRQRWKEMRSQMISPQISAAEGQVLQAFDRWSQESGVTLSGIRPQWKRGSDDASTLECRAEAVGSLSNLTRFLHLLEADPLALKVEAVELVTRDPAGQQISLVIQVNGLVLPSPPKGS